MTPSLIPFKPEHNGGLVNRDDGQVNDEDQAMLIAKATAGPAYTMVLGEAIVGAGGVIVTHPGVGYAWLNLTEVVGRYGIWLTKVVAGVLREAIDGHDLHRIEAAVVGNYDTNQRWLERFGFVFEGVSRQFTSERIDALRFAWVRED